MTASKSTVLWEKLRLQFRTEFFSLTNSPRFAPPNSGYGTPHFGVVSSQLNPPSILQFGPKMMY